MSLGSFGFLILSACTSELEPVGTEPTGTFSTGTSTTGTTSTTTTTVTGTSTTLGLTFSGDRPPGLRLAFVEVLLSGAGGVGDDWEDVLVTAATQDVDLRDPSYESLVEVDPGQYPNLLVRAWHPYAYVDGDVDGAFTPGEPIVGWAGPMVLFADGDLPFDLVALGLTRGWNTADLSGVYSLDGSPPFQDAEVVGVEVRLDALGRSAGISGDHEGDASDRRAMLLSLSADSLAPLGDGEEASAWSFELSGQPALSDVVEQPDGAGTFVYAAAVGLSYLDDDGSGRFEGTEVIERFACTAEGRLGGLMWIGGLAERQTAASFGQLGLAPGWQAITLAVDFADVLPVFPGEDLSLREACPVTFDAR